MVFVFFWVLGVEGTIGSQEVLKSLPMEKRIINFILLTYYFLIIYTFYTEGTLISNTFPYIINELLPFKIQKYTLLTNFLKIFVVVGTVGFVGIIGTQGISVVGIKIIILVGLTVAIIGIENKNTSQFSHHLSSIISIFIIWFGISMFLKNNIQEAIPLSFQLTLICLIPLLTIKKIGLGINLIIFAISILIFISYNTSNLYFIGLFIIILPLTNSILDYISLKISLYMAREILVDKSIIKVFLHLLADLMVAIILLLGLALFLYFSIELFNDYSTENIPIKEMLNSAYHDPFSLKNGWITFMLLSTLVPTFVHLVIAMGALLIEIFPAQKSLEKLQAYTKGEEATLESSAHYFTRILFLQVLFSFAIVGAIIYLILYLV